MATNSKSSVKPKALRVCRSSLPVALGLMFIIIITITVKPVLSDHPTVQGKVVVIDRWSLKQGFPETDRFFKALLNSWSLKTGKIRSLVQKMQVAGRVRQVVA